jgi:peptidyl-prolyl cis-trans isomerase D
MLSLMRKHAGSWMIKVILGAIVVTFVFWGGYQYSSQRLSRVASVNDQWITIDEYNNTYNQFLDQVRRTFGNNLTDDLLQSLGLHKRALDQLIDNAVMMQAAEKLNLTVSDDDLAQAITSMPIFQNNGVFDESRYQLLLTQNKLTRSQFEAMQREALQLQKLRQFITGSVKVSDPEALEWYNWNNAEVSIDYVLVETNRYTDIEPADGDLEKYFEENKTAYKTDPTVKARYLVFKPEAYRSRVQVSDDEIQYYYETNLEQFKSPKTVEARHILIKVDQEADDATVAEARKRIEDILQKVREGQDFAELAKQYSEGPTKDKGGYLGEFQRDSMVKPFADKAFSMAAGEISDPVRTRFGWHLIKVEKVNEPSTTALDDARAEIQKKLANEQAKMLAQEDAEAASDAVYEGDDLDGIAAQHNLTIQQTDHFSQKDPAKGIKNGRQFASVAFELPDNEISDIQDFGDGYYLIEVIEKIPSEIPEFASTKDKVRKDWVKQEQDEMARADANNVLDDLKNGVPFDEVARKVGLEPKHTDFFKRDGSIPDIGNEPEISQVAFKLSDANKIANEAIGSQKGYYAISLRDRKAAAPDQFEAQKAEIKQRLLQQKQFRTFDAWLLDTKSNAEITIVDEYQKI